MIPEERKRSGIGPENVGQQSKQRCLAGAVRAYEGENLARMNLE